MKLLGYARVSSDSQKENCSIEHQENKIKAYCDLYDHQLVSIESEIESGKNMADRPVLTSILERLANGEGDGLIVSKLDRLARNTKELLTIADDLKEMGKNLIIIELAIDTSTPAGRLALTIQGSFAEYERSQIIERITMGKKAKQDKGLFSGGGVPFGKKSDKSVGLLVDNEDEKKIIETIRRHHKSGKSLRQIATYLNLNNLLSKQGKKWSHQSVKAVLARLYPDRVTKGTKGVKTLAIA